MGLFEPHGRSRRPLRPNALIRPTSAAASLTRKEQPSPQNFGSTDAAIIVIHTLAHAIGAAGAAADAGRSVILLSAADAGIYAGPGWFGALVDAARAAVPGARFIALLDCGDRPGAALAAIRAGSEGIIFVGRADVAARLADIAGQYGVRFLIERPAAGLDLVGDFFASESASKHRCTEFLAPAGPSEFGALV